MEKFWEISVALAGIGAVGLFVLFALYKKWLSHPSLNNKLTKVQIFKLMQIFLVLTFATASFSIYAFTKERRDQANFSQIESPIFSELFSRNDRFNWQAEYQVCPTASKEDGVILEFSATNPNDFDITVEEIKVIVVEYMDGEGVKSMTYAAGAGYQSTPQVTGEIRNKTTILPLTGTAGEKYIIDANGDKAHFATKIKARQAGLYTLKMLITVSALNTTKDLDVGITQIALSDEMLSSYHRGAREVTYRFN